MTDQNETEKKECKKCGGSGVMEREPTEEEVEEDLNEIYGDVSICGLEYPAGRALKEIDPIAFRCAVSEAEMKDEECDACDGTGEEQEEEKKEGA